MPRVMMAILAMLAAVALIPFALIARARATLTPQPRIHLVQDMDNQARYKSQQVNPIFADGRAMRPPVAGTLAREVVLDNDAFTQGLEAGQWVTAFPVPVTGSLLRRGQERFEIYCAPCHGLSGHGDGIVAVRADKLQEGLWVPPSSLHDPTVRARAIGHFFNTITNGIRTMPAYGSQIPVQDRWAIVSYVLALQRSQHATVADVPPTEASNLR